MPDLSNAYTDFSAIPLYPKTFQTASVGDRPCAARITTGRKIIYFNFPRFVNLEEPPPKRLELIHRIAYFSPKYEIRDVSDHLDQLRMYQDDYAIEQLRKATQISGEAMIEAMRSAHPGMNEEQLRATFNYTCNMKGATRFGFPTSIRTGPGQL